MTARRLARWALRAALLGALATGAIYTANAASADELGPVHQGPSQGPSDGGTNTKDGAVWG